MWHTFKVCHIRNNPLGIWDFNIRISETIASTISALLNYYYFPA